MNFHQLDVVLISIPQGVTKHKPDPHNTYHTQAFRDGGSVDGRCITTPAVSRLHKIRTDGLDLNSIWGYHAYNLSCAASSIYTENDDDRDLWTHGDALTVNEVCGVKTNFCLITLCMKSDDGPVTKNDVVYMRPPTAETGDSYTSTTKMEVYFSIKCPARKKITICPMERVWKDFPNSTNFPKHCATHKSCGTPYDLIFRNNNGKAVWTSLGHLTVAELSGDTTANGRLGTAILNSSNLLAAATSVCARRCGAL